ncbi:magnesium transporter NIPA-domain-containing protein [Aspergillus granulosus]|uniref:Magnesium transporter NIPA-domain-containing protein n=1 Tax=Aspergillus granulosus TaxID=176169 RepID=A0ABR4HY08_9EURO
MDFDLLPRSGISTGGGDRPPAYKAVGIALAVASGLFIGVSFVLKKVGLLRANVKYNEEAGEGYGYLKNLWWWSGMILMIIGEICNFVAYAFVDAILVTPLGALSVVITTILSAIFLKERLSFVGQVGCFTCILGSVVIALNAPEQSSVANIQEMKEYVIAPGFLSYAGVVIVGCTFTALWAGPRYGKRSMFVYISICSLIGGLSVVATQGLGAAILAQINGEAQFNQWFMYVLLVFVIATLLTEIIYLNKALNIFNAALVTPTYYVFFTSATIITSAILFRGFKGSGMQIATVILGFLQICSGVVLLQLSKSAKDVPDAAVFKGDLDQIREVATQQEPESEPKADAIRGAAAIIRRLSTPRRNVEAEEARRYFRERHEDHLKPPGEDEIVEWDGLRRRKTVLGEKSPTTLRRTPTPLPPLGMSRFPDDWEESSQVSNNTQSIINEVRSRASSILNSSWRPIQDDHHHEPLPVSDPKAIDASYVGSHLNPNTPRTVSWADQDEQNHGQTQDSSHLTAPEPPQHRHFSFQRIFNRSKSEVDHQYQSASTSPTRSRSPQSPTRRGILRRTHRRINTSEEERLGLVQGDTVASTYMNEKLQRSDSQSSHDSYDSDPQIIHHNDYDDDKKPELLPTGRRLDVDSPEESLYPPRLRVNPLPPLPDDASSVESHSQSYPQQVEIERSQQPQQLQSPDERKSSSSRGSLLAVPRRQSGWRRHDSGSSGDSRNGNGSGSGSGSGQGWAFV